VRWEADAYDASTGVPLSGASLLAYQGATLEGSAVISPSVYTYTSNQVGFPPSVYTNFNSYSDVLNLPVGSGYQAKINKSGYTNGTQPAYQHSGTDYIGSGQWDWFGRTGVPPKSASIETVLGWWWNGGLDMGVTNPVLQIWIWISGCRSFQTQWILDNPPSLLSAMKAMPSATWRTTREAP